MSKPTGLVAEDENALVTLLRYNLEREGYRVLEARDGEEALLIAAEEKPDLVILDWMMPQLSGIEVCRRLRRDPACPACGPQATLHDLSQHAATAGAACAV